MKILTTTIAAIALAMLVPSVASASPCCVRQTYDHTDGALLGGVFNLYDGSTLLLSQKINSGVAHKSVSAVEPDGSGQCDAAALRSVTESLEGTVSGAGAGVAFSWSYAGALQFLARGEVVAHHGGAPNGVVGVTVNIPKSPLVVNGVIFNAFLAYAKTSQGDFSYVNTQLVDNLINMPDANVAEIYGSYTAAGNGPNVYTDSGPLYC